MSTRVRGYATERAKWEWPTIALICAVYGVWLGLTASFDTMPLWCSVPLGAAVVALHGSLQHEVIHGHPTPKRWLNHLLVFPNLWLYLPFGIYRESHLAHHGSASIADPVDDPESYYCAPGRWPQLHRMTQALWWFNQTLVGRVLLGPLRVVGTLLRDELARLRARDASHVRHWVQHALSVGGVLAWVVFVCDMSVLVYVLAFAFPGLALTLVRSYTEHRAALDDEHRTAIVESGPLLSLIFLNNNLHAVHHDEPGLPWYDIPGRYRRRREFYLERNGGFFVPGYLSLLRRFAFKPKDPPIFPTA